MLGLCVCYGVQLWCYCRHNKLQTNIRIIEENEAAEASKMFIKPLDSVRSDSVHRDRSD